MFFVLFMLCLLVLFDMCLFGLLRLKLCVCAFVLFDVVRVSVCCGVVLCGLY